ncbi:hypothetical protein [Mucilaginibacter sp. UR6-11]|uniref:hypothetical protein n=1 Tax=Mucilaginibacter sp. UR6-11 TaxID=1435644 RepID=UPI001E3772A2|nr:hypothetical protein [Mucilaginibacter sp. UR6-11]MCC8424521.1 hypothetical protein [Mucilaginibacter sp. UR6-11]
MKTYYIIIAIMLAGSLSALAQMDKAKDTTKAPKRHTHHMNGVEMDDMDMMDMDMGSMKMNSQFSLDLPMNRDGSGSSWVPDESPMYAYMIQGKKWMSMIHGSFFARYNNQDLFKSGNRGGQKFDVPNMVMAMTQTRVGSNGLFAINTMFSLDPFLIGAGGYPLLFQTGESYQGKKLVDRQHPHDLFAELSVAYTQRVAKDADLSLSFGYPGEPALGPPVFMHRLSAINNPNAPLGHHYQDATHITFGVATLGFRYKDVKIEGSAFTGREPDEFRYNFDEMKFDSYSVRVSYNPSKEWALQLSDGMIHSPEEAEPAQNVNRFTASAIHTKMLSEDSYVATTLVYGQNHYSDNGKTQPSILLENSLQFARAAVYGRYEFVQKDAEEMDMHAMFPANPNFNIHALTLGTNYILATVKSTSLTLGVQGTLNRSPSALKSYYGAAPVGFQAYLRISPALIKMKPAMKM